MLTACAGIAPRSPAVAVESPPCSPPPFGDRVLYLRGSMNNWAALDEYALQYRCDAYYLNVAFDARHDFKLADASWSDARTFGSKPGGSGDVAAGQPFALTTNASGGGTANLRFAYAGEQTLSLRVAGDGPQLTIGPRSFVDPNARSVTDPLALSVRFDSRALADKVPFGAQAAGAEFEFALSADAGIDAVTLVVERRKLEGNQEVLEYTEAARVPMQAHETGGRVRWQARQRLDEVGVYGYWFDIRIGAQRYVYQNNRDPIFWTRERGSGGLGEISFAPAKQQAIRRYRQTVYAADFVVPDWAPDIVYYYIFPERFRNGDASNDPRVGARSFHEHPIEVHADWNERPYVPGSGDGSDAWSGNDFYGGDLQGIIEKLDYIQSLGANTVYITPLFFAASNHKYDTADYRRIDPAFGSEADFARLTAAAAQRGIRVLPDTSLNHTGSDSIYFDRFTKYPGIGAFEGARVHPESAYASWYRFQPDAPDADGQYAGWTGVADLPELDKSSADFRAFAYGGPDALMQHWLNLGAAGWRMDVAPWVPDDFWRGWRHAIKAQYPDALTVAETWFDASKYFLGDTFDSTMNYIFRNTLLEYAAGGDARKLYPNIEQMREAYPPQAFYALMNLLSTHDQARSLHVLGATEQADAGAIALARQRLLLAVFFQMTFPGAPTVYYGDEVGLSGGDDPYNRATYPWADRGGKPDAAMLAQFQQLIQLRRQHPVLRRGSLSAPVLLDQHAIVLERRLGSTLALVASNNGSAAANLQLALPACAADAEFVDALSGERVAAHGQQLQWSVPALAGRVLLAERPGCAQTANADSISLSGAPSLRD